MLKKIKQGLKQNKFFMMLYSPPKKDLDFIYNLEDLNPDYYDKIKDSGDIELEHQIGRLINFKNIISEIKRDNIKGDFLEFGSYQGFSLLWMARLMENVGLLDRKIVGIDSFEGLPNSEGVFEKGAFNNTSRKICRDNVILNKNLKHYVAADNVFVEKYSFAEKKAIIKQLADITKEKFCFVHIDCDISSSAREVFQILVEGEFLADRCYLLFDDYGCMESYKNTIDELLAEVKGYDIKERSATKLTKNFVLARR